MKEIFSSHPLASRPHFVTRIEELMPQLPRQEAKVAQFILLNALELGFETGASIAMKAGTSEVTVSRLLSRLGYRGMPGLKREIQAEQSAGQLGIARSAALDDEPLKDVLDAELRALITVFEQFSGDRAQRMVEVVAQARSVFVTGFQSVRGAAEDFARRLALARDDVRFLAAHDSMLTEWVGRAPTGAGERPDCVIVVDVVPYAREAPILCQMCLDTGRDIVVVSDESCHWAQNYTDLIVHAPSRSGLFLESTGALVSALNVLVHSVAERDPKAMRDRLQRWQSMTRKVNIF
jgi:DNA-binding MurR/RpiR family transcriptional regulator